MSILSLELDDIDPVPDNLEEILLLYHHDHACKSHIHSTNNNDMQPSTPPLVVGTPPEEKEEGLLCLVRETYSSVSSNTIDNDVDNSKTSSSCDDYDDNNTQHRLYKDDYEEYTILEKHLEFSESINILNNLGHYILLELKNKKVEGGLFKDAIVELTYSIIGNIIKAKISGTCTLMNELMCLLDEMLFAEVENVSHFYIDDKKFPVTQIYYGQEQWLDIHEQQKFVFISETSSLVEGEVMILLCFINDYMSLLDGIQEHIDSRQTKYSTHLKASRISTKIYEKLDRLKEKYLSIINKSITNQD